MNHQEALRRMEDIFGSRLNHMLWQLAHYAEHEQAAFDVTFYGREPLLEVTLDKEFSHALRRWCLFDGGAGKLKDLCERIAFSDGTIVDISDIWTINYVPPDLDTAAVTDLSKGEEVIGAGGETVREIIRETYHCKSRAEEDHFLRRWIAS
jgi:hypothetical protein